MKRKNWSKKRQELTEQEKIDKNYKQLSNCLGRIVQTAYEDKTQLRRLKAWYNLIGLAIADVEKEHIKITLTIKITIKKNILIYKNYFINLLIETDDSMS